ncbi:MAG: ComF family protein [Oscillospiraceae bacterium]|nr:ComF family protein [Oscillospiraceae bacterium]
MSVMTDWLLDLLYPPKCVICRRVMDNGSLLCPDCGAKLPRVETDRQKQSLPPLNACISPLYYTGPFREAFLRYKFRGLTVYSRVFGELMADSLRSHMPENLDVITWAPLSRSRKRSRGYDQAELLAAEVAKRTGQKLERLLVKTKNNPAQSGQQSREAREQNVQGVYRQARNLQGEHILLVDDIVTTGATLRSAASVLLEAGASEVTALTLARADQ